MGKFTVCLMALAILVSGCTFSYEVLTPAPAVTETATSQSTPESTQVPATPVATISATAVAAGPTLAPPTTEPIFFNGRSSATVDDHLTRSTSFAAGTKQVYVIWDYDNMKQGMLVRREWYLNGQPWLTREEAWDFARYGSTGTMRDVSIHDEINGLDSGVYHLRIYIDNVMQPLGSLFYQPIQDWVSFQIGLPEPESYMGYGSWDGQWVVEVYGGNRVVLRNIVTGEIKPIVTVQEVAYVNWFKDNQHFLLVDRNRSEQSPDTNIGIRDHLWIVDVPSGESRRVYRGDTSFAGTLGPDPSPDGKYVASLIGSGYADGCFKDSHLLFFVVANDFSTVRVIQQEDFSGLPVFNEGWIFPVIQGFWENEHAYQVTLDGTCNADRSKLGNFRFNLADLSAVQLSPVSGQPIPADLGTCSVHGKVTGAGGAQVANDTMICGYHSHASPSFCAGVLTTGADGTFNFPNVFFRDSDAITTTVQAAGY